MNTTRPGRRAVATIILVVFVLILLAMMGFASFFQSSGTGRTYARVVDMRQTIEAGESAIAEAVSYIRTSMDRGITTAECRDDWKQLLLGELQNSGPPSSAQKSVHPKLSIDTFKNEIPPLSMQDVTVRIVDFYKPPPPYNVNVKPPAGLLEFSVVVTGAQKLMHVKKKITQRRYFYIYASQQELIDTGGNLTNSIAKFWLVSRPLGTVVE